MANKNRAYEKEIIKKIDDFLKDREEIIFAYVFGSFAESGTFNDIDLAVYIDEVNRLTKGIFYEIELSKKLEEILKIPVDVIILNRSSDVLLYRISKGILIKNNDDDLRINFITTHWKEYWDFKHKVHEHIEEMKYGYR